MSTPPQIYSRPYKEYAILPFAKNKVRCVCGFEFKTEKGIETHICPSCQRRLNFR